MKPEEEQLVAGCRNHNQKACKRLYDMFAPSMMAVCMRYMGNRAEAQDVMQDGFIKVFNNIGKLRTSAVLSAWIRRIMVNTAIDTIRKKADLVSVEAVEDEKNLGVAADAFDNIGVEAIMEALAVLPDTQRVIFNLCEIEGYSDAEVAATLGMKEPSIRSARCRARQALQKILAKNE